MSAAVIPEINAKKEKQPTEEMTLVTEQEKLEVAQKELDELIELRQAYESATVQCPMCGFRGETSIEKINGPGNYLMCVGIGLAGGLFGCCLAPFYIPRLKEVVHSCSKCGHVLATSNKCYGRCRDQKS